MAKIIEVVQGMHFATPPQQIKGSDGNPYTGLLSGDVLSVSLYPGDELAPITPAPTASWVSAAAGTFVIDVGQAATVSLPPGDYSLQVIVTRNASAGGLVELVYRGILRVLDAAGSGSFGPSYCMPDDLEEFYPDITYLARQSDQTGFARARHTAWAEINRAIIERVDLMPGKARRRLTSAPVIGVGYDVPDLTTPPPSVPLLRASLATGTGLILDATDAPIMARIAAGKTLEIVLRSKEGGDRARNPIVESARQAGADAMSDLRRFQPFIDLINPWPGGTQDGTADLQIMADSRPVYLNGWGL